MPSLADKKIVVGITGGIAAYKSAELVRRLMDHGAGVQVVMTDAAKAFITPLTLQALSGRPVRDTLLDSSAESGMGHIEIARWADHLVVAPASADFIARLASGMASDLLATVCLATSAPIILAPAMNQGMWRKSATQRNIATLMADGITIVGPASGEQACGDVGPGRMLEPSEIISHLTRTGNNHSLDGASVTITAGPTWEALDPVRALSNHSSGKMGYAVAIAAAAAGAAVTLISGPTALNPPPGIQYRPVQSAEEMLAAVEQDIDTCNVFIGVAAVADYRPLRSETSKIKKHSDSVTLELVRTPDILARVAQHTKRPFTVGFAAETDRAIPNAREKLHNKGLDLIAVNQVDETNNPFGSEENHLILISKTDEIDLGRDSKTVLAEKLISEIAHRYHDEYSA
ncbi:MAG TPA: bifunctional phosphopantothenoylcysteine decarboxylase/phosphopantothenate--cysteine ligase CoaBC [Gammaproteobacteria bacterium]|nr:bifunctional phosphopantothenoylcysteine decarboxylase/phosphopantothenate--cysteine ligase CoaBC [Gammaproteobacteria bacterium]